MDVPTRNVVLTNHQALLVEQLVDSGRYQNASEVLRDGLRLIEQREIANSARIEALRHAVDVGIDDFEQGRFISFDTAEELDAFLDAAASKAISAA